MNEWRDIDQEISRLAGQQLVFLSLPNEGNEISKPDEKKH